MKDLLNKKKPLLIASLSAFIFVAAVVIILVSGKEPENPPPAPTARPVPELSAEAISVPTKPPLVIPIDFASLQAQNPHVYAWIQIPDTNINYPILQHPEDNAYYLTHTMFGEQKTEGSIYTENYNTKDFNDPNTIIYGHNMKNGSMFKHLHKFEDRSFFDTHRTMYIYTPTQILEYTIFAAYVSDNAHLLYTYDFSNPNVYTEYLRAVMMKKGHIDTGMNLNSANKIITLQTCTGNSETRYLVQAVLSKVQGEPDIIIPDTLILPGSAPQEPVSPEAVTQ
ncbi:MAG: class B sortase [Lachnospiraceae bacterium]|nr:class B sortase [Lachnospiraceae bacterium]